MKALNTALVILSGGQDSVTCLGLALARYESVHAIHFRYNQRHAVPELACVENICSRHNVPLKVVDMGDLLRNLVTSALTGDGEVGLPHQYKPGLPSSFVPGRNALFLVLAHAHAQEIGATVLYTGVCQTDFSGYPDCRAEFISGMTRALNTGYETNIRIHTPLMYLTKGETFGLADKIGFLQEVLEHSHTCYNGEHTTRHEWGFGCGTCPACELRRKGWEEYKAHLLSGKNYTYLTGL